MTLSQKISAHLNNVLDFRIDSVLRPITIKAGPIAIAGLTLLTAAASMGVEAKTNDYPEMHQHAGKVPSIFSKKQSTAKIADEKRQGAQSYSLSGRELERLKGRGLHIQNLSCATAVFKMFAEGENARKFSTQEKIIAVNFIQPLLTNGDDTLLQRYATAIDSADSAYTYNWDNVRKAAKSFGNTLSGSQYYQKVENSVEIAANSGMKSVFEAVGFKETTDKLDKAIKRSEDQQRRAESSRERELTRELDKKLSYILEEVGKNMKSGTSQLNFSTAESMEINQKLYSEIIELLKPTAESISSTEAACAPTQRLM